jgi:hypothetical protein
MEKGQQEQEVHRAVLEGIAYIDDPRYREERHKQSTVVSGVPTMQYTTTVTLPAYYKATCPVAKPHNIEVHHPQEGKDHPSAYNKRMWRFSLLSAFCFVWTTVFLSLGLWVRGELWVAVIIAVPFDAICILIILGNYNSTYLEIQDGIMTVTHGPLKVVGCCRDRVVKTSSIMEVVCKRTQCESSGHPTRLMYEVCYVDWNGTYTALVRLLINPNEAHFIQQELERALGSTVPRVVQLGTVGISVN